MATYEKYGAPPPAYPPPPEDSTGYYQGQSTVTTFPPGTSVQPGNTPVPPGNMVTYGPLSVRIICQHCQTEVTTRITPVAGIVTWLACGGLAIFGCFLGCCLIPFCVDSLKDNLHTCPNCHQQVGLRKLIS